MSEKKYTDLNASLNEAKENPKDIVIERKAPKNIILPESEPKKSPFCPVCGFVDPFIDKPFTRTICRNCSNNVVFL